MILFKQCTINGPYIQEMFDNKSLLHCFVDFFFFVFREFLFYIPMIADM